MLLLLALIAHPAAGQGNGAPLVPPPLAFTDDVDRITLFYPLGENIEPATLPRAAGGIGQILYSLTSAHSAQGVGNIGLTFDPATGGLTGTPNVAGLGLIDDSGTVLRDTDNAFGRGYPYYYCAHDAVGGIVSTLVFITVCEDGARPAGDQSCVPPGFEALGLPTLAAEYTWIVGEPIPALVIDEATGGSGSEPQLRYRLSALPPGLAFDPDSRTLSGTPTRIGSTEVTLTITDVGTGSAEKTVFTVNITPNGPRWTLPPEQSDITLNIRSIFEQDSQNLTPPTNLTGDFTYSLTRADGSRLPDFGSDGDAGNDYISLLANRQSGYSFLPSIALAAGVEGGSILLLRFTVTDNIGTDSVGMASVNIRITFSSLGLSRAPIIGASETPQLPVNRPIEPLRLEPAIGATGEVTYRLGATSGIGGSFDFIPLSETLARGLVFDPETLTISGTPRPALQFPGQPRQPAQTVGLAYLATDDLGTVETNVQIQIIGPRLGVPEAPTWPVGVPVSLTLPQAENTLEGLISGATYTLTGPNGTDLSELPGLAFDPDSRVLTGTPRALGRTVLTYTADVNEETNFIRPQIGTAIETFTVTVVGPGLTAPANREFTVGNPITPIILPSATTLDGVATYTLSGQDDSPLPDGLHFDPQRLRLSGTPTNGTGRIILNYRVRDDVGIITVPFVVTVNGPQLFPQSDVTTLAGQSVNLALLAPVGGGSGTVTYTLTGPFGGPLPAGLRFDPRPFERQLSGRPLDVGRTLLTYSATRGGLTTRITFTLTVTGLSLLPLDDLTLPVGAVSSSFLLAATGGTFPIDYRLVGPNGTDLSALPGLSFDGNTLELSGTPTRATGPVTLVYTATPTSQANLASHGTARRSFTVTVVGPSLATPFNQTWSARSEIRPLVLPAATNAVGEVTYRLTGPNGDALPDALVFTPDSRILSGIPLRVGTTRLSYSATDDRGTARVAFDVTVTVTATAMLLLPQPANRSYPNGRRISDTPLPEARNTIGPVRYRVTGTLPAGVSFNPETRMLFGTPNGGLVTESQLTYVASDDVDDVSTTFTITTTGPDLASITVPTYALGMAITPLTLPFATGTIIGTATYALTAENGSAIDGTDDSALPGLTFLPASRVLTGTPLFYSSSSVRVVYRVTDDVATTERVLNVNFTGPDLPRQPDRAFVVGQELSHFVAVGFEDNSGTISYSLTLGVDTTFNNALSEQGLSFNNTDGMLTGTPTATIEAELTLRVTQNGTATRSFTFRVVANPNISLPAPPSYIFRRGQPVDVVLPAAATAISDRAFYALTSVLPGLTFDGNTRRLSGVPTTATDPIEPRYSLVEFARPDTTGGAEPDLDGRFETVPATTFTVGVIDTGPGLPVVPSITLQNGQLFQLDLPPATDTTGVPTYRLVGPNGLDLSAFGSRSTFDPGRCSPTYTPVLCGFAGRLSAATGTHRLFYSVTDDAGTVSTSFTITVTPTLALPDNQTATVGTPIPPLTLPLPADALSTSTLESSLTGPGGVAVGAILPGLTYTPASHTLTGTPTVGTGPVMLTYTVIERDGTDIRITHTVTFTVTVTGPRLTAPANQSYLVGVAIDTLTLPSATGTTGDTAYTLTGTAGATLATTVPGLTFDAAERTLSGTPTMDIPDPVTLTYTATDIVGTARVTFALDATGLLLSAPEAQTYPVGVAITNLTLPDATVTDGPVSYRLTTNGLDLSALPGLTFDAARRILSGTPTAAVGPLTLTYSATDPFITVPVTFAVTVTGPRLPAPDNQSYTVGVAISPVILPAVPERGFVPPERGFVGAPVYSLDLSALPGLTFDAARRILSGTPTVATAGPLTLTWRVADDTSAAAVGFTINVAPRGPGLSAPPNQRYPVGTAIATLTLPAATDLDGPAPLYRLSDLAALPGLTFDAANRTLSGTPTAAVGPVTLRYTAVGDNGAATVTFTVTTIGLQLGAPPNQSWVVGTALPALTLPAATNAVGPAVATTLTGPAGAALAVAVPGLTYDPASRILSGTPTAAVAPLTLTYRATNTVATATVGTAVATFRVSVAAAGPSLSAPPALTVPAGRALSLAPLPVADNVVGAVVYALTGPGGAALATALPRLTFDADDRTLSGTPTAATAAPVRLTYTATDTVGTAAVVFGVTVTAAGPSLRAPANQTLRVGRALALAPLPAADNVVGAVVYALTGPDGAALATALPGLTFDAAERTLSGTPTAATTGPVTLTYSASDDTGATTVVFTLTVTAGASLTAPANQRYPVGRPIPPLTLSRAVGAGLSEYRLTDANGVDLSALPGLTFDPDRRVLSGTPTVGSAPITVRYTASNPNAVAVATFTIAITGAQLAAIDDPPSWPVGVAITPLTLPAGRAATGLPVSALTVVDGTALATALPGLTFDPVSRILSGTPTRSTGAAPVLLRYTVTDAVGVAARRFAVTVIGPQLPPLPPQVFATGEALVPLTLPAAAEDSVTGAVVYALTGPAGEALDAVVPGLRFEPDRRQLSGVPRVGSAPVTLRYTASDDVGTAVAALVVAVIGPDLRAPDDPTLAVGTATALLLPAADNLRGSARYTLTGADGAALAAVLPGLTFNPLSRTLSGVALTTTAVALTYSVFDNIAAARTTFRVTVVGPGLAAPADLEVAAGNEIFPRVLPSASASQGRVRYALSTADGGSLSATGLVFTPASRVLSGIPTVVGVIRLRYTASDDVGTVMAEFSVTVAGPGLAAPADQRWMLGRSIQQIQLPEATERTGAAVYTLTGPGGRPLPPGLSFFAFTRVLTGMPLQRGTTTLVYTARDNAGAVAVRFDVTVDGLVLVPLAPLPAYIAGQEITPLTLPAASETTGAVTVTLGGDPLPPGLVFDAASRVLSGRPTAGRPTRLALTYTATDSISTDRFEFGLSVLGPQLDAPPDQRYVAGREIPFLELPVATGVDGSAALSYTLTDAAGTAVDELLPGLVFSTATPVPSLSGAPNVVGTVHADLRGHRRHHHRRRQSGLYPSASPACGCARRLTPAIRLACPSAR